MKHINITNFEGSITDWTKLNYIAGGTEGNYSYFYELGYTKE